MTAIHMHFFRELYAELTAFRRSVRHAKDISERSNEVQEKSAQRRNIEQILMMASKKSRNKIDIKSTVCSIAKRLLPIMFFQPAPSAREV